MPNAMALLGVPTTRKFANEEEKAVARPTFHTLTLASVAMGKTIGPRTRGEDGEGVEELAKTGTQSDG